MSEINQNYGDEQIPEMYESMLAVREIFDKIEADSAKMAATSYDDLSRNLYAEFQKNAAVTAEVFEVMRPMFANAAKVVGNPALRAHMQAVMDSD